MKIHVFFSLGSFAVIAGEFGQCFRITLAKSSDALIMTLSHPDIKYAAMDSLSQPPIASSTPLKQSFPQISKSVPQQTLLLSWAGQVIGNDALHVDDLTDGYVFLQVRLSISIKQSSINLE